MKILLSFIAIMLLISVSDPDTSLTKKKEKKIEYKKKPKYDYDKLNEQMDKQVYKFDKKSNKKSDSIK